MDSNIFPASILYTPAIFGSFVHDQFQNIRSGIVADRIVFHPAGRRQSHIQIRVYDRLFIPYRFSHIMPEGVDDAAAAPAYDLRLAIDYGFLEQIIRIRCPADKHIRVDEKAFAFDSDMLYGRLPFGIVISVRRKVNGYSLLVQRRPGKRHIAFPADHAPHRSPRSLCDREIVFIRIPPYDSL